MLFTGKEMAETGVIPRFYGVAYYKTGYDAVVMFPIPINKIVGTIRRWWINLKHAPKIAEHDGKVLTAYLKGRSDGIEIGEQHFWDRIFSRVEQSTDGEKNRK